MTGDFSRKTFDPEKHYSGVLMQQGRVQLDADWNEQLEIQKHRTVTEAKDVIGTCGVPKKGDGFKIGITPDGSDLTISPGRIYVDGLLCELEATTIPISFVAGNQQQVVVPYLIIDGRELEKGQWMEISAANKEDKKLLKIINVDNDTCILTLDSSVAEFQNAGPATVRCITTYFTQPYYPNPDDTCFVTSPPNSGIYIVFLDVWQREINYRDDPYIREVALGEADTTTRIKNIWQVKLLSIIDEASPPSSPPVGEVTCDHSFAAWNNYTAPTTGTTNVRTRLTGNEKEPCQSPPSSGYRGLENQLYRVEIHTGGLRSQATFKWSRDNASVETRIEKIDGNIITVSDIGKDEVFSFAGGQWVEIVDEESTLKGTPHPLI